MSAKPESDKESGSGSDSESADTVPEPQPVSRARILRRLSSGGGGRFSNRRYKPLSRSVSLTVADFTSQWSDVFRMFDVNLDGVLSCDDLGGKMRSLGYNVTETEVEDLVHEWDKDEKGALSLTEFTLMMGSSRHRSSSGSDGARDTGLMLELKAAFDLFDRDKNGLLDLEEVKTALHLMGESLTDRDVEFIVSEADTDKDGAVSFREFCDVVLGRSLSPASPFYFRGATGGTPGAEAERNRVRLEYQTDHVTARTGV